ncbi:hypothetical protein KVT40_008929 [Elsinoe batatas]|uniref:Protein kinase domain-containing protein n=1 Tax=Elsinoe batatas TaxID=2601811 RepID=A0A8K0PE94_9PEZI|nr:hypothetical protein KVT40_008929 [Elsinoe batatas]
MRADAPHDEARTLLHLANATKDDAGRHPVVKLYDFFCHAGPNGCHACLVLELLGSDVSRVLRKTFDEKEGFEPMPYLCTAWILLDTLAWLHQHQVWHLNVRFEKLLVEIYKLFVGDVGSGETSPRWIYDAGQASNFYGQWQGRLAQLRLGLGEDAVLSEELGERMAERRMASGNTQDIVEALVPASGRILEGMLLADGSERTSLVDARDEIEALMAVVGTWSLST